MVYDIVVGMAPADVKRLGKRGTILLGKQYVQMGQVSSLSNEIYMDVSRSHVVFVVGKRGSGKSYTLGIVAEGMSNLEPEISKNLSIIILDTMGIYWTMKYGNLAQSELLREWGIEPKGLPIIIFTPEGAFEDYRKRGVPTDYSFSIRSSDLSSLDWCRTLGVEINDPIGVLIDRAVDTLREKGDFGIDEIIEFAKNDQLSEKFERNAVINRFTAAKKWGIFGDKGTPVKTLVKGGQVTVIDVSCYAMTPGAEGLRALAIGLISKKLFISRMVSRKAEEVASIERSIHYVEEEGEVSDVKEPLVWLLIDEAHEFLPNEGVTAASDALITILREGRQPGISLILASQQPGKIHTDVMTQSDIVIAHRLTAKIDVESLGMLMQSYMREGLDKQINNLPKLKGAAIIFDDTNERIHSMKVRPRVTWHGGEAPDALKMAKKEVVL